MFRKEKVGRQFKKKPLLSKKEKRKKKKEKKEKRPTGLV